MVFIIALPITPWFFWRVWRAPDFDMRQVTTDRDAEDFDRHGNQVGRRLLQLGMPHTVWAIATTN